MTANGGVNFAFGYNRLQVGGFSYSSTCSVCSPALSLASFVLLVFVQHDGALVFDRRRACRRCVR